MTNDTHLQGVMFLVVRNVGGRNDRALVPVKVTHRYPNVVDADCVVVKIRTIIPKAAFEALPAGDVVISLNQLQVPVEVTPV